MDSRNKAIPIKSYFELIDKYSCFIFDCDGVIWREAVYIDNTVKFIQELKEKKKSVCFLTNSNSTARQFLQQKLKSGGIETDISHTYTASYLIAKHISEEYPHVKKVYLIGQEGLEQELNHVGINVVGGFRDNEKVLKIERAGELEIEEDIDAVVCGFDYNFNYYKLTYASLVIQKTGLFFGTNYDYHFKVDDKLIPGSYAFIAALETCSEKKAEIITKPDPRSLELIMNDHRIKEIKEVLMIGDNMKTDIKFGNNAKIDSLLVLTGVTSKEDFTNPNNEQVSKPTYYLLPDN